LGIFFPAYSEENDSIYPHIIKGVLNLKGYDFVKKGVLPLNGEWEFYWEQFIDPFSFLKDLKIIPAAYCEIPHFWTEKKLNGKDYPPFGYATYHLAITLDKSAPLLGISVRDVYSAYTLFINGYPIIENGKVGKNQESTSAESLPRIAFFKPDSDILHITIHVANFSNRYAGVSFIQLGEANKIFKAVNFNITVDALLFGSIGIIGIYHLLLFILRKQEKNLLFFGLFCFIVAIRTLLMGERLLRLPLLFLDAHIVFILEYLTVPLSAIFFSSFFYYHYRLRWYFWIQCLLIFVSAIHIGITIFAPLILSMLLATYYYIAVILTCVFVLVGIVQALKEKRQGALIFLIGFIIIFATVVNDVLTFNRIIIGPYLLSFGLFIFIFSQATIISIYFSTTFKEKERLAKQLDIEIKGTIQVIIKLLATKDPYTAGHQKRVTELAVQIAKELGLGERDIEAITLAGQIHDIGKISIPSEILCKPGRLSELEFDLIKTHPQIGFDILKEIKFPWPIAQIVYQHHEHIDGSGYPQGLRNQEIDFLAKILTVADVVEAIASDRPYRAALGIEEGLRYIMEKRDQFFDSKIVDVCLGIFKRKDFAFLTEALGENVNL
jgi:putative nucleotidyltransferase with HDIG domain